MQKKRQYNKATFSRPLALPRQRGAATGKEEKRIKATQNTEKKIRSETKANFLQSAKKYPDNIGEIYNITEREKEMKEVTRENYKAICEKIAFSDQITEEERNSAITLAELWAKLGYEEAIEVYNGRFSKKQKKKFGYCHSVNARRVFDIIAEILEDNTEEKEKKEMKDTMTDWEIGKDNSRRRMTAHKTKTGITPEQWKQIKEEASVFHPQMMLENIIKAADGTIYFDRTKVVQSKEYEQRFYYTLKSEYVSPWRDIENITVYFEKAGNEIAAGAYNLVTGEKN